MIAATVESPITTKNYQLLRRLLAMPLFDAHPDEQLLETGHHADLHIELIALVRLALADALPLGCMRLNSLLAPVRRWLRGRCASSRAKASETKSPAGAFPYMLFRSRGENRYSKSDHNARSVTTFGVFTMLD